MYKFVCVLAFFALVSCKNSSEEKTAEVLVTEIWTENYQTISLTGDTLRASTPSASLQKKYNDKKEAYLANSKNLDALIWYGRFTAYMGNYREAINIYTSGLQQFPDNSRLLRHRGHRYISLREFDKAIEDLNKAAKLIQGKENRVEEDGMPNAQNIPVSTMHGNIYYHLGLAYYLNGNFPAALEAYENCLQTSPNPDNVVSATHWLYMIRRRMNQPEEAEKYLSNISPQMNVIENQSYHKACLFYKGELPMDEVYDPISEATPSNAALKYAIGNWYLYNDLPDQARGIFNTMLSGDDWASFGYIAAEADMVRVFDQK
ncbi:MAG: tetratricopeptide repeat protein [Bacteroidota bacterium]